MDINQSEHYNINTVVSIINKRFNTNLSNRDVHELLQWKKINPIIVPSMPKVTWYNKDSVINLISQIEYIPKKLDKKHYLNLGDVVFKTNTNNHNNNSHNIINKNDNIYDYHTDDSEYEYKNGENDMEKYSDYLINQKYQFESKKKIKITEESYKRLFEDVFMTNPDNKRKTIQLKYNKNSGKYNKGNASSLDMIKTDKMDANNSDTYEVPLKGGFVSYNITSINGTEVMHYFKRIFNKQKTYAKISKYGNEEYELEMQDTEFRNFIEQFVIKVNNVVTSQINNFNSEDIDGVSIYPVPSSSNFNLEMAKRMQFNTIAGYKPNVINQNLLKKNLANLKKDEDFISKNSDYYSERYSDNMPKNISHMDYVNKEYNRFSAIVKAQQNIDVANTIAKKLIIKYYNRKEVNTDKYYAKLNELYLEYIKTVNDITRLSTYFDDVAKKYSNIYLSKIAKELKYSKGPSIEERTNEVYDMLKSHGYLNDLPRTKLTQICYWEPVKFEIKKLSNDVRMALMNYFQPNEDKELVNTEIENNINKAVVIFDDNISGGATLSDICLQLKNIGFKYIIPITFGKMKESWNAKSIIINKPKNWNF